ncbi:MAG: hypothetical protein J2P43_01175 [Candidatus Dormibacteraeota bacterium]|nr:hypothetical protein [Candidatus Dormibacteraeota bacterium]
MSAIVKLSSAMPGDPGVNGIDALADDLVKDPRQLRVAICWYDVAKTTVDTDTDDHVPTIRIRRIEPLGDLEEINPKIADLVQDAIAARTGRTPLPFDLVEPGDGYDPDQLQLEE